jgi:hypothetical protein
MITPNEAKTIASIISGKIKIKITSGDTWKYNHRSKTVYYRTADLSQIDEVDVISNLLHECGHGKYTDDPDNADIQFIENDCPPNTWRKIWRNFFFLLNVIEDFRMEDLVRKSYPFAVDYLPEYSFKTLWEMNNIVKAFASAKPPKWIQYLMGSYIEVGAYKTKLIGEIDPDVKDVIAKTRDILVNARQSKSSTEVLKKIEKIYPDVKQWLLDLTDKDESKMEFPIGLTDLDDKVTYEQLYSDVKELINPLVAVLRKSLTDNLFNRLGGRFRTGKGIDNRVLYKARLGLTKIFTRVEEAKAKDYLVALLVDESGSMNSYSKNINAARSAVLFANALEKLDIPYSLYGFNSGIRCYKTDKEKLSVKHHFGFESCYNNTHGGGSDRENSSDYNSDGYAVKVVKESLRGNSDKKILIVLTDGQPAPSPEHRHENLELNLIATQKEGVTIFGIGIGRDVNVYKYYKNGLQVNDISELPKALGSILIKALK